VLKAKHKWLQVRAIFLEDRRLEMFYQFTKSRFTRAAMIFIIVMQLQACGGGGSGSDAGIASVSGAGTGASTASTTVPSATTPSPSSGSDSQGADTDASAGEFNLAWTAPVTRADGTPLSLSEIDGFRIYYGKSAGSYTNYSDVTDGSAQSVTVQGVPVGTYYIVMTTLDSGGRESSYSSTVTKVAA
jgi:hypothetical protein